MSLFMILDFFRVLVCEGAGFTFGTLLFKGRHCVACRGRNRMLTLDLALDKVLENNGCLIESLFEKLSIFVWCHLVNRLSFLYERQDIKSRLYVTLSNEVSSLLAKSSESLLCQADSKSVMVTITYRLYDNSIFQQFITDFIDLIKSFNNNDLEVWGDL